MRSRTGGSSIRVFFIACVSWIVLLSSGQLCAQDQPDEVSGSERKTVSFFWREGCAHCSREKEFLEGLQQTLPDLELFGFNIDEPAGRDLFNAFTSRHNISKVTPITIIGRKFIIGFDAPETTGAQIQRLLSEERSDSTLEGLFETLDPQDAEGEKCSDEGSSRPDELRYLTVPLIGRIDLAKLTLPSLSMVLGLIDGFNPCAMWVLLAFLTALAQIGSARKMIQFAGVFILAQALMYFLILNSWFAAFDFIRADRIVTPLVGLLAIGGGIFFLWEFRQADGTCRVTSFEKRTETISRINALSRRSFTPMVILGILGIAFSVNIVEFACSIGIPQAYTKILDLNRVGLLERESLMGIYILFYMADDFVVFAVAIWSVEKIGLTTRYSRMCNLAGGVIMVILGLMLLFAPQALRF